MKNLFIVFEGIDGSGTSTQAALLKDYFTAKGRGAVLTCEPSNGPIGNLIRQAMKKRVLFVNDTQKFDEQMAYLFAADRHDHLYNEVDGVYKLLKDNLTVIGTRYYFSSLAYNWHTPEDREFISRLNQKFPNPDLVVYIDIPAELGVTRIGDRSVKEIYENQEKLAKVRKNYQEIFSNYDGLVFQVDGTQDKETVREKIVTFIEENFD
ncbi:dTMP kinase [Planktothrix sp. FACHB-1355]|uniref:Thymidylate kinase n=1 Tax=Aerosakkonema funiforme FACHB-1375 TaxID=2949571 RepID=A0A926VHN6_9CYAN|nr:MULTISPECIES: dTMP kinase [Oscillatoriales]MBD2183318.1 dTMP kinase [Aerosakkonema funiforme FACHB-1375]MBD3560170.1 dTMP kinase [Planktothrix sp. FACHB-1355]